MKGVWLLPGGSKDVAVKMLKEGSPEEDTVKFLQEAAIHGQFWHPNVVKLMGVVTVGEPVSRINKFFVTFGRTICCIAWDRQRAPYSFNQRCLRLPLAGRLDCINSLRCYTCGNVLKWLVLLG